MWLLEWCLSWMKSYCYAVLADTPQPSLSAVPRVSKIALHITIPHHKCVGLQFRTLTNIFDSSHSLSHLELHIRLIVHWNAINAFYTATTYTNKTDDQSYTHLRLPLFAESSS
ncbi:hypothetical protein EDC04DRAFT_1384646 [Pisolithus marmoratus]|nr:hypothetical protein EDC04DRAFT_1384646 [Pisolithus marmoratus]